MRGVTSIEEYTKKVPSQQGSSKIETERRMRHENVQLEIIRQRNPNNWQTNFPIQDSTHLILSQLIIQQTINPLEHTAVC